MQYLISNTLFLLYMGITQDIEWNSNDTIQQTSYFLVNLSYLVTINEFNQEKEKENHLRVPKK